VGEIKYQWSRDRKCQSLPLYDCPQPQPGLSEEGSLDYLKKEEIYDPNLSPSDFEDTLSDEEAEERSVREARMWTAIDALPERCREIFLLNKRDGMKYREIAAKFQISVNTVDNHISKALRLIREGTQKVYAFLFN
jgi:RNA polymerase sigma factor (sigma-70 family)